MASRMNQKRPTPNSICLGLLQNNPVFYWEKRDSGKSYTDEKKTSFELLQLGDEYVKGLPIVLSFLVDMKICLIKTVKKYLETSWIHFRILLPQITQCNSRRYNGLNVKSKTKIHSEYT